MWIVYLQLLNVRVKGFILSVLALICFLSNEDYADFEKFSVKYSQYEDLELLGTPGHFESRPFNNSWKWVIKSTKGVR